MTVSNSTFVGNLAENHGGAIAAWGQGAVEVSNCSFLGNEAVGSGDYRRAGSGGAVYASPGVHVTVRGRGGEGRGWGRGVRSCGLLPPAAGTPRFFFWQGFKREACFHTAAAATTVTIATPAVVGFGYQ